ncbi:LysM peptidoglycan-binding domain-containing protein [Brachyspira pilosicoli]|uniref:LysM peptidoglycan-binding domain-containing protein n=1 Tax=Brachyspira pilosicoli TaxID=52584 RepID=UPI001CA52195|nr:TmpB protein [Brachyspira pilosicoli]MBW5397617.1 TmpB protein [Brachyspira pilosicoli]
MKKVLLILFAACYLIYGQDTNANITNENIKDSEDYQLAQRYRELAIEAHNAGDYTQSIEFSRQSKEYSDKVIAKFGVYGLVLNAQRYAERNLALLKGVGGDTNESSIYLYEESIMDYEAGNTIFNAATNDTDYSNSITKYTDSSLKSKLGYDLVSIGLRRDYLINEGAITNADSNDNKILNLRYNAVMFSKAKDYNSSISNANEAINILDMLEAPIAYAKAQKALNKAKEDGYNETKMTNYNQASTTLIFAKQALDGEDFSNSLFNSKLVIEMVNAMYNGADYNQETTIVETTGVLFPKYYKVQYRKVGTDSLWKIASYDFIYGDGNLWKKIYEANKDKIKDPNIIINGQILLIPSLKGETRDGTYDSNNEYGNIKDIK